MSKTVKMTLEISEHLHGFAKWAAEQQGYESAEDYLNAALNAAVLAAKREMELARREERLLVEDDGGGVWLADDVKHGFGF